MAVTTPSPSPNLVVIAPSPSPSFRSCPSPSLRPSPSPSLRPSSSPSLRPSPSPSLRPSPSPSLYSISVSPTPSPTARKLVVTFSQKSGELRIVQQLVECLETLGVSRENIFYQPDISLVDQENHWISQWLYAQRHSKVVVCLLSCAYLRSKPCCMEWKLIPEWQRLVVGVDPPVELLKTEITGFNGPPLAYIQCEEQILDARALTPMQIATKIMEKYELNKEKSHAFELRRGSPVSADELATAVNYLAEGDSAGSLKPTPEIAPLHTPRTDRRSSLSRILRTPPMKFLIPSLPESKGSGDDGAHRGSTKPRKISPPSRGSLSEIDSLKLTPSRATKDKSWFG